MQEKCMKTKTKTIINVPVMMMMMMILILALSHQGYIIHLMALKDSGLYCSVLCWSSQV